MFNDTWTWGQAEDEILESLQINSNQNKKRLAELILLARAINDERKTTRSAAAYLCNMAVRLLSMKRVLKDTGSIYLHCDPTMSHYLKLVLDLIFGENNFRNEIIWHYQAGTRPKDRFGKKHDIILFYSKCNNVFNVQRKPSLNPLNYTKIDEHGEKYLVNGQGVKYYLKDGQTCDDVWTYVHEKQFNSLSSNSKERLGFPTQKPLALLERIIKASSKEGDIVLDPFCGCGTTVQAAENLKRNWVGIDISKFSTGLIRERICNNVANLQRSDIRIFNVPDNLKSARDLASQDPFEFEKWVCGEIGAHGMFREPGKRGADKGVDGIIDFGLFKGLNKLSKGYAIVQVKGGNVTPDSVKALNDTVKKFEATAGVFVCFDKYMNTVENSRNKDTYNDLSGTYPVIQGFSIENLLAKKKPNLPPLVFRKNALLI